MVKCKQGEYTEQYMTDKDAKELKELLRGLVGLISLHRLPTLIQHHVASEHPELADVYFEMASKSERGIQEDDVTFHDGHLYVHAHGSAMRDFLAPGHRYQSLLEKGEPVKVITLYGPKLTPGERVVIIEHLPDLISDKLRALCYRFAHAAQVELEFVNEDMSVIHHLERRYRKLPHQH
jgi:hypothetical protein